MLLHMSGTWLLVHHTLFLLLLLLLVSPDSYRAYSFQYANVRSKPQKKNRTRFLAEDVYTSVDDSPVSKALWARLSKVHVLLTSTASVATVRSLRRLTETCLLNGSAAVHSGSYWFHYPVRRDVCKRTKQRLLKIKDLQFGNRPYITGSLRDGKCVHPVNRLLLTAQPLAGWLYQPF